MSEIPKLCVFLKHGMEHFIGGEDSLLTEAQAAEVIRRAEAKVYRAKLVKARFDESTITIKVGRDFWDKYEISAGHIDIVEGGGIGPIEQALEADNGKD